MTRRRSAAHPDRTIIPYFLVDAVVEAPFGFAPRRDVLRLRAGRGADQGVGEAQQDTGDDAALYLDKYVYGVKDHAGTGSGSARSGCKAWPSAVRSPASRPAHERARLQPDRAVDLHRSPLMEDDTTAFIGTGIPMLAAHAGPEHAGTQPGGGLRVRRHRRHPEELPIAVGERAHLPPRPSRPPASARSSRRPSAASSSTASWAARRSTPTAISTATSSAITTIPRCACRAAAAATTSARIAGGRSPSCATTSGVSSRRLTFVTTPGYLTGPGAREAAGLPPGTGPYRVVTNLAVLGYHPDTQAHAAPGAPARRQRSSRWSRTPASSCSSPIAVEQAAPPSDEELRILRDEIDKDRFYI